MKVQKYAFFDVFLSASVKRFLFWYLAFDVPVCLMSVLFFYLYSDSFSPWISFPAFFACVWLPMHGMIIMIQRRKSRPFARTSEGWMRRLQTTQPSFKQGFLLELLVFLGLMFFRTLWFDVLLYCFKRNTSGSCDKVAAAPEWGIVPIDILFNLFRKMLAHLSG